MLLIGVQLLDSKYVQSHKDLSVAVEENIKNFDHET